MSVKQTVGLDSQKITALYERLSRDDDQVLSLIHISEPTRP